MKHTNPVRASQTIFRWVMPVLAAAVLLITLPVAQAGGKQSVIMQISENDPLVWNLALNIAKNLPQELGKDNVEVEIVAFGPGLAMFKAESEVNKRLTEAAQAGVALRACGRTMKAQKLAQTDLHRGVGVVPGGVVEIIAKTRDGWTYLRP
jgi:hypothetical protein